MANYKPYNPGKSARKHDSDNYAYYGIAATIGAIVLGILVFAKGYTIWGGVAALLVWLVAVYVYKNVFQRIWVFAIALVLCYLCLIGLS